MGSWTDFGIRSENWMAQYPELFDVPLRDLVLPGTHDSFTYNMSTSSEVAPDIPSHLLAEVQNNHLPFVVWWAKTQKVGLYEQLKAGMRRLDLRVVWNREGVPWLSHGLFCITLDTAITDIKRFCDEQQSTPRPDVVIVHLVVVRDQSALYSYSPPTDAVQQIATRLAPLDPYRVGRSVNSSDPAGFTLRQMWSRGKARLVTVIEAPAERRPSSWSDSLWDADAYSAGAWAEPNSAVTDVWRNASTAFAATDNARKVLAVPTQLTPPSSPLTWYGRSTGLMPLADEINPLVLPWIVDPWAGRRGFVASVDAGQTQDTYPIVLERCVRASLAPGPWLMAYSRPTFYSHSAYGSNSAHTLTLGSARRTDRWTRFGSTPATLPGDSAEALPGYMRLWTRPTIVPYRSGGVLRLLATWRGWTDDDAVAVYVMASQPGGRGWDRSTLTHLTTDVHGAVAAVQVGDRIAFAWYTSRGALMVARSDPGSIRPSAARSTGETTGVAPALALWRGTVVLAWTGTDPGRHLNVRWGPDGESYPNKHTLGDQSARGPSLAVSGGKLWMAWRGDVGSSGPGALNVTSADTLPFDSSAAKWVSPSDNSWLAPSLTGAPRRLGLAWVGSSDSTMNVMESRDGRNWFGKQTLAEAAPDGISLCWFAELRPSPRAQGQLDIVGAGPVNVGPAHFLRAPTGAWEQGFDLVDSGRNHSSVACAWTGATLNYVGVEDGKLWRYARNADGSWLPDPETVQYQVGDDPGQFSAVACAATGQDLQVAGLVGGKLMHALRLADGTWQRTFGQVAGAVGQDPGTFTAMAVAGAGADLHVLGVVGGRLLHTIRFGDGSWQRSFGELDRPSAVSSWTRVSATAGPDGMTVVALGLGTAGARICARRRNPDGSWSAWSDVAALVGQELGAVTDVACARAGAELHVTALVDGAPVHTVRAADSSWQRYFGSVRNAAGDYPGAISAIACAGAS
jgi:hypothetical protein